MKMASILALRLRMIIRDTANGVLELLHNGFAMVGLLVALGLTVLAARADLRVGGEQRLVQWLQDRQEQQAGMDIEPSAIDRSTATNPKDLPKAQAAVAFWLANKYRVAPEPIAALVATAHELGASAKLDPHLILAIAAIESGFNPFAQSPVGAQGLMQVMTNIHSDKYSHFGGKLAAFDPVTNLRVGVKVLQECISRAGSVDAGLKYYVGAALHDTDGGYAAKVYAEQARIKEVSAGRHVPLSTPQIAGGHTVAASQSGILVNASAIVDTTSNVLSGPSPASVANPDGAAPDPVTLNKL